MKKESIKCLDCEFFKIREGNPNDYYAFDEPVPDAMTGAREEWLDWLKQEEQDG